MRFTYWIEDWYDRLAGESFADSFAKRVPVAIQYVKRAASLGLPRDDEVLYGKIGSLGYLVHVSELG